MMASVARWPSLEERLQELACAGFTLDTVRPNYAAGRGAQLELPDALTPSDLYGEVEVIPRFRPDSVIVQAYQPHCVAPRFG